MMKTLLLKSLTGKLTNELRQIIPAHISPGCEDRGKNGLQADHDGFKLHGEIILFLIIGDSQYSL